MEVGPVCRIKWGRLGECHWEGGIWTETCRSEEISQASPWGTSSPEAGQQKKVSLGCLGIERKCGGWSWGARSWSETCRVSRSHGALFGFLRTLTLRVYIYLFLAEMSLSCYAQLGRAGVLLFNCVWASHCSGFSFWRRSCKASGLSSCSYWALAHRLSCPVARPGSLWTRDWNCVPCHGRRILNHRTTRGAPGLWLLCGTKWFKRMTWPDIILGRNPGCCGFEIDLAW